MKERLISTHNTAFCSSLGLKPAQKNVCLTSNKFRSCFIWLYRQPTSGSLFKNLATLICCSANVYLYLLPLSWITLSNILQVWSALKYNNTLYWWFCFGRASSTRKVTSYKLVIQSYLTWCRLSGEETGRLYGRKILAVYLFNPNILLTSNQVSEELSLNQWFDSMAQMLIIQRTEFPYP